MKLPPKLPDWIARILIKFVGKILPMEKLTEKLKSVSLNEIYLFTQPLIEEFSDEYLERAIKDFKEGNYYGLGDFISRLEKAGLTQDVLIQWLENEKFLREHRRKYHPEGEPK